jgi:hypothetical protein
MKMFGTQKIEKNKLKSALFSPTSTTSSPFISVSRGRML